MILFSNRSSSYLRTSSNSSSFTFSTTFQRTVPSAKILQGTSVPFNEFIFLRAYLYTPWYLVTSFLSWWNCIKLSSLKQKLLIGSWSLSSCTSSHSLTALSLAGSSSFLDCIVKEKRTSAWEFEQCKIIKLNITH